MSLAHSYAQVILEKENDTKFLEQLLSYMKAKGHTSLLPHVIRILKRTPRKDAAVVRVAKEGDAATYKQGIEAGLQAVGVREARTLVDPRVVGGYVVVGRGKAVDRTFRSALVSLYRRVVRS